MKKNICKKLLSAIFATGVSIAIFGGLPTNPTAMAQQPSEADVTDVEVAEVPSEAEPDDPSTDERAAQGCVIRAHKVSESGPIKGKVTATNCRGWVVWYGMQVDRWHGPTRIAGRDAFAGQSGKHTYTVKACKKGTYNYRMYISRRGGAGSLVTHVEGAWNRRKC